MALSSTDAAGDHLAIAGDGFAGLDQHHVAAAQRPEGWLTAWPRHASGVAWLASASLNPLSGRAAMVVRRPRKVAACCLPRPSARGFGEVGEQHGEPEPHRDRQDEARRGLGLAAQRMIHRIVVRMLPA